METHDAPVPEKHAGRLLHSCPFLSPQVVHKALLNVAEVGTEAAAATGMKMVPLSAKVGPKTIVNFNRAFLMAIIHEDSNAILFLSKVANPKQT